MGTTDFATRVTLRTGETHQDVLESAAVVDCRIVVAAGPSQVVVGVGLVQTKRLCTQNQAVSSLFAPGIHLHSLCILPSQPEGLTSLLVVSSSQQSVEDVVVPLPGVLPDHPVLWRTNKLFKNIGAQVKF